MRTPRRRALILEGVAVWIVDVERDPPDVGVCTAEERQTPRALAARAVLRAVLGQVTESDAAALTFVEGPHGKPALPRGPEFNMSHSGRLVAVAVADRPVGVDIEVGRRLVRRDRLAGRLGLVAAPDDGAVLRAWTRSEALLKATGEGISGGGGLRNAESRLRADGWDVRDLTGLPADAFGAVAAYGLDWSLTRR